MNRTAYPIQTVPKSYFNSFVRTSMLIAAGLALVVVVGVYLTGREGGTSYADSYKLIAELDRVLVTKSLELFSFTLLLMIAGIVVISIAYSHRVAGPLYKLGMHSRKIAAGDLADPVRLRQNDVIHVLADDMNSISRRYRDLIAHLEIKTRELEAVMANAEKHAPLCSSPNSINEIAERIDEIKELLNQIKL